MRRCQALMFACPCRSVLPGYHWVPADGISAAAYKRDSAHSAGGSKLRLQRLSVCAKVLRNVCFWHKADIRAMLIHVRFRGKADIARTRLNVR